MFEQQEFNARRVARAAFETDRLLVVGDVTLPPEGYQSRFSDSLNRAELEFMPLTNCDVTSLADGQTRKQGFIMLSKRHIRCAYPIETSTTEEPAAAEVESGDPAPVADVAEPDGSVPQQV